MARVFYPVSYDYQYGRTITIFRDSDFFIELPAWASFEDAWRRCRTEARRRTGKSIYTIVPDDVLPPSITGPQACYKEFQD